MTQFTTIKEYDNAVRASQRKLKGLNERLKANPLDGVAQQQKELAQAGHKFLLASRAKFKELEVNQSPDAIFKDEVKKHLAGDPGIGDTRPEYLKPNAAQPQALTHRDRAREHVPHARVVRERAHAGAMRAHKYAADDSRAQGLGYKVLQRRAESKRFVMALGVKPVFPSMRDATCFLMRNSDRRILVNGQAW